jgi:hypothetical protein
MKIPSRSAPARCVCARHSEGSAQQQRGRSCPAVVRQRPCATGFRSAGLRYLRGRTRLGIGMTGFVAGVVTGTSRHMIVAGAVLRREPLSLVIMGSSASGTGSSASGTAGSALCAGNHEVQQNAPNPFRRGDVHLPRSRHRTCSFRCGGCARLASNSHRAVAATKAPGNNCQVLSCSWSCTARTPAKRRRFDEDWRPQQPAAPATFCRNLQRDWYFN